MWFNGAAQYPNQDFAMSSAIVANALVAHDQKKSSATRTSINTVPREMPLLLMYSLQNLRQVPPASSALPRLLLNLTYQYPTYPTYGEGWNIMQPRRSGPVDIPTSLPAFPPTPDNLSVVSKLLLEFEKANVLAHLKRAINSVRSQEPSSIVSSSSVATSESSVATSNTSETKRASGSSSTRGLQSAPETVDLHRYGQECMKPSKKRSRKQVDRQSWRKQFCSNAYRISPGAL
eukprot:scaffold3296_cov112-Cylindrotheca_fusiformis.AAC.5